MRSILSKATTGAMIAGAALLVAACGGSDTNVTATNTTDMGNDTMMANETDQGMDTNSMDMNSADANATTTTTTDAGGNTTTTTNTQ